MMTAEDVKSAARTHEVGVHSYSHESMGFEDDDFFHEDVRRCRAFFEDRLQLPLAVYAFPNGSYRPAHLEHLFANGFKHALLVEDRAAATRGWVLPRLSVHGSSPLELRLRALGHRW
jgi:peptidoglycan/xylan/chitin deacetylase (PgdA/CDA1 family)